MKTETIPADKPVLGWHWVAKDRTYRDEGR